MANEATAPGPSKERPKLPDNACLALRKSVSLTSSVRMRFNSSRNCSTDESVTAFRTSPEASKICLVRPVPNDEYAP